MPLWLILGCLLGADSDLAKPDPCALARRIDARLAARYEAEGVPPAERADDAEFLRRISLDLIGRIPASAEIRTFLGDASTDKRDRLVDRLLADPEHARHFARTWRALLLPEAETEPQVRYLVPGFEAWLVQLRTENAGFDRLVRELLTPPIARPGELPQFVLRDMKRPNPIAFFAAKNAEAAKIASSSVRLFLGLRLECAQCHDHPFDHWTRKQFWNQAAFFAGIERRGQGTFAPLVEAAERRSIPLMDTPEAVPARFLDLAEPPIGDGQSPRVPFADWMTSPRNPYFARAVVNRLWSQLMGLGLVDPVDDVRDSNPASHPELLDDLAGAFAESGFDVTYVLRALCLTEAYQRTSRQNVVGKPRPELFTRMAIKSLSGEQFLDSLMQAIGHDEPVESARENGDDNPLRRRILGIFAGPGITGDPETSVAQALALMNGSVVQRAVTLESSGRLKSIVAEFPDAPERQIKALYLATVSRYPTPDERQMLQEFCGDAAAPDHTKRLGDVFWMLLNSAEFRWNH